MLLLPNYSCLIQDDCKSLPVVTAGDEIKMVDPSIINLFLDIAPTKNHKTNSSPRHPSGICFTTGSRHWRSTSFTLRRPRHFHGVQIPPRGFPRCEGSQGEGFGGSTRLRLTKTWLMIRCGSRLEGSDGICVLLVGTGNG